jgi:hypothetical protein
VTSELLLCVKALQKLLKGEQPLMVPVNLTNKRKLRFYVGTPLEKDSGEYTIL